MSYIVTQGTCQKSQVYSTILNALISAGWSNASSNPTTDFDVLTSTGTSGTQSLTINLRATDNTNANSTVTTNYNYCSYRLVGGYTAGTGGASGTFARPSETWQPLAIAATANASGNNISSTTNVNYKYFANKNFIVISLEYPIAINVAPQVIFIGIPDATFCSEPTSRGLLVMQAANAYSNNNVAHVTDASGENPSSSTSVTRNVYCQLAPKNPNSAGQYMLSDIWYGNTSEGYRGRITGVQAIPNQNCLSGDTITVGTSTYYVLVCGSYGFSAFPSSALVIQTA